METLTTILVLAGLIVLVIIVSAIAMQFVSRSRSAARGDKVAGPVASPARAERAARYGAQAPTDEDAIEDDGRDPAGHARPGARS